MYLPRKQKHPLETSKLIIFSFFFSLIGLDFASYKEISQETTLSSSEIPPTSHLLQLSLPKQKAAIFLSRLSISSLPHCA